MPGDTGGRSKAYLRVLSEPDREALRQRARPRQWRAGERLFLAGDPADRVFLLEEGRVKIVTCTDDGRDVLLAVRADGDLIGELSSLDGGRRSASAVAIGDVRALVLDGREFLRYLESVPTAAAALLAVLAARLRDADVKRIEFAALDAAGRVARRLVELAEEYGEPDGDAVRVDVGLSQDEIAGWTGSSREAVARALHRFRSAGWVTTERRQVVVQDLAALRQRSR